MPKFGECYLKYLRDYLPNLKELEVTGTAYNERLFSETYTSLALGVSFKLKKYLKQLQRFYCKTLLFDSYNSSDNFWQMMHEIYDNQDFCNLCIHFYTGRGFMYETISYDKQRFNVECYFNKERFDSMAHPFDFLDLNLIQVHYSKVNSEGWEDTDDNHSMSDLLTFATSQQRAQLHLTIDEEQFILSTSTVVLGNNFKFSQDVSIPQYVYLEKLHLDDILLNNINTLYPTIKSMRLIDCRIHVESGKMSNSFIDLPQFKYLRELTLDFNLQEEYSQIVFQWTNGDQQRYYRFDKSMSDIAMQPKPTEVIPKDIHVLKLKTFELQRLTFRRGNRKLEIINT